LKISAKLKKKFPGLFIIVGGNNAELNWTLYYSKSIDLIYHDNGLKTFDALIKASFSREAVKSASGVCYKENGKWVENAKGEAICEFEFEPLRLTDYKKTNLYSLGSFALVKGSWSCPHKCSFCCCRKMNNGKYTLINLESLLCEIEKIAHDKIFLVDDDFFADKTRSEEFCKAILDRNIKKQFIAYARADFICENYDMLPLVKSAGFSNILVGLEAINDDILKSFSKQTTKEINEKCVRNLRENNIDCICSFIVTPDFTRKNFNDLKFFIKRNKIQRYLISPLVPFDSQINGKIKSKRLDGIAINFKPKNMTKVEYFIRLCIFYARLFINYALKRGK